MIDELRKLSQNFLKLKNSPYRRYFIKTTSFQHRLSLLLGQRGIGKTTTLIQFLLDKASQDIYDPSILYVQADHFLVGNTSLYEIAESFQAMGGKYLALDEIHKHPNWSQELKSIYDTFPNLFVIASGSSALHVHKGSHDLARRAIKYYMVGLSFKEFLELSFPLHFNTVTLPEILNDHVRKSAEIIEILAQLDLKILPLFKNYLRYGYYPYFFELSNEELYYITLQQNLHSTIEVDLAAVHPRLTGVSIAKLKQLLSFIAQSVPFTPHWTSIKDILGVGDVRTLRTYFAYLEDASLIRMLGKENQKLDHLNSIEKVYLDNPNQMHALTFNNPNLGTERELFFLNMLSLNHTINLTNKGDFSVDRTHFFEVGGSKKSFAQVAHEQKAFLACDNMEIGIGAKIPLWIFGFLY